MAQQVKFYSVATMPQTPNAGALYFVDGGELYKGAQRFGLGRVTVDDKFNPSTSSKDGQAKGDIVVTGGGAGWVFDGSAWRKVGGDTTSLRSDWQSDISASLAGLVQGLGTSYITHITKDANGKVTAQTADFADAVKKAINDVIKYSDSNGFTVGVSTKDGTVEHVEISAPKLTTGETDGTVKLGAGDVKVFGWDTVKEDISNLQYVVSYSGSGDRVVTAETGNFTNLNVTGTADFTATTVEASSLTVADESKATFGRNTISAIAQREAQTKIDALDSDNDVAGTAQKGGAFALTGVTQVDGVITSVDSSVELEVVSNKDTTISTEIKTENNHYPTSKAVQDYVTTKMAAVVTPMNFLGVKTSTTDVKNPKNGDVVLVGTKEFVYDGSAGKWVELGDEGIYSTKNFTGEGTTTLTTTAQTLAGAVNELDAELGTITADAMGTTASTVSGAIKELDGKGETLTGDDTVEGSVAKAKKDAKDYTDTKVKEVTDAFTGGSDNDGNAGVNVSVTTAAKTAVPDVKVTVTKATLNTTLGTSAVADKTVATTIGDGSDTALATTSAVKAAITAAELVWLGADGNAIA